MTSKDLHAHCPLLKDKLRSFTLSEHKEIMVELLVIAETRLGILCGDQPPTPLAWDIARAEVLEFLRVLRANSQHHTQGDLFAAMRAAANSHT